MRHKEMVLHACNCSPRKGSGRDSDSDRDRDSGVEAVLKI